MLLCLCYIMGPILIGTLKPVSFILSFVSQSNLFTLINVLGITNYVLNRAEGEFESVSFDITTSLSTQKKMLYNCLLSQHKEKHIFFLLFHDKAQVSIRLWLQYNFDKNTQKILHFLSYRIK